MADIREFNHAPGSPLPWRSEEGKRDFGAFGRAARIFSGRQQIALFAADGRGTQIADAEYAAHAADNYPRLVRVVRERARLPEGDAERSLLRMIGEEE